MGFGRLVLVLVLVSFFGGLGLFMNDYDYYCFNYILIIMLL